jgi:hypothetical protein
MYASQWIFSHTRFPDLGRSHPRLFSPRHSRFFRCMAVAALTFGSGEFAAVFDAAQADSTPRHLSVGDSLEYSHRGNDLRVFGMNAPNFDDRAGRPEDASGRLVNVRWDTKIIVKDVRYSPDGSDAWYFVDLKSGWDMQIPIQVWVRASELTAQKEDALTHVQVYQLPAPTPDMAKEKVADSLALEAQVTDASYRVKHSKQFEQLNGFPRVYKVGELCQADTRRGPSTFVPLRTGPSATATLEGFLENGSFISLESLTSEGWWRVSFPLKDGTMRKAYIAEWLIEQCGAPTPYAKSLRYDLKSANAAG